MFWNKSNINKVNIKGNHIYVDANVNIDGGIDGDSISIHPHEPALNKQQLIQAITKNILSNLSNNNYILTKRDKRTGRFTKA